MGHTHVHVVLILMKAEKKKTPMSYFHLCVFSPEGGCSVCVVDGDGRVLHSLLLRFGCWLLSHTQVLQNKQLLLKERPFCHVYTLKLKHARKADESLEKLPKSPNLE